MKMYLVFIIGCAHAYATESHTAPDETLRVPTTVSTQPSSAQTEEEAAAYTRGVQAAKFLLENSQDKWPEWAQAALKAAEEDTRRRMPEQPRGIEGYPIYPQ